MRLAGFLGVVAVILAAYFGDGFHVLLALLAFFPVLFVITLAQQKAGTLGMAITVFGVVWIGVALAHGVLLRDLPHGGGIIVDILVGTFVGDSGAYIGGRWFGQRKLAPSVSPNKTLEGLLIGMVTAVLATWLAGTYQDWLSGTDALLLGLGVALAAPLGDLFESFIKRDAGHEGHRPPVRSPRRGAGPPRRRAVQRGRGLLHLARAAVGPQRRRTSTTRRLRAVVEPPAWRVARVAVAASVARVRSARRAGRRRRSVSVRRPAATE